MAKMKNNLKSDLNNAEEVKNSQMVNDSYFYDFRQNIFRNDMDKRFIEMFLEGDGNELVSKACAVRSSSMLGYNFFHWISDETPLTIEFENNQIVSYTKVFFEVKMRVFKGKTPANMDIVLTNEKNEILFIESKFLEYLETGKFSIAETYKKAESYYCLGEKWASLISSLKTDLSGQYWGGIKQEISHMIALNNWANDKTTIEELPPYDKKKDIRFINLVFEPDKEYGKEHEAYTNYKARYDELHDKLSKNELIPDGIKVCFKSYSELWPSINCCISPELKQYLINRYMQFANNA